MDASTTCTLEIISIFETVVNNSGQRQVFKDRVRLHNFDNLGTQPSSDEAVGVLEIRWPLIRKFERAL